MPACDEKTQPASGKSDPPTQEQSETPEQTPTKKTDDETSEEPEFIATLVADMSFGSGNEELILTYEYGYNGSVSVAILAQGLSELTGLNFAVNDSKDDSSNVRLDWSSDATFIAGLGDTPQKDEFFVYDSESLTWFMLNSMYRTILENLGGRLEVFYSMDGWNPMMNEVFAAEGGFPVDLPYTGNHSGRGDEFDDDLSGDDGEFPYWSGFNFGPNLSYEEEFEIQSDPGENMNAAEAAKLTFDTMRDSEHIPEVDNDTQYTMVLVDLTDIEGEECYVYRLDVDEPTGTIGAAYAYAYQSGNIYMQGYGGQWLLISSAEAFG